MGESIHEIIRRAEQNYIYGTTKIGAHVDWSMHDTIERILAYINSKHIHGDKDSLGRDKPFFNIVTAVINIWYRITDIDRKDIVVKADKTSNIIAAFFANALLQDWMKKTRFGVFLNKWGRILSQYGSAVVKFIEKDGELIPSVVPWNRIICDPVDFDALPRIEKIYRTPAQLKKEKLYNQDVVKNLLKATTSRKTLTGVNKDNQNEFIELYEVHGELPWALLKNNPTDKDWENYRQQMHVVSYQVGVKEGTYEDFTLYRGLEKNDPYLLTHLIEEDGRTLSIGPVEYLFDAQWMQNHTIKSMKDTLDLSSKLIFQTADSNYIARNILSSIETGDILIHELNKPLTQINNSKGDISALENFGTLWRVLEKEVTATPDAARGITPPSGTPYSTTAALLQQSNSLFEVMIENKGFAIEDMLRNWIIPHLKTKMDNKEEIMTLMQDHDIKKLDAMYIPNEAIRRYNKHATDAILNLKSIQPFHQVKSLFEQNVQESLAPLGNQRPLAPGDVSWKEALKDIEWKLESMVSNELLDKQATLTTLSSLIQGINPTTIQDPFVKLLMLKVLNLTGVVSPAEISTLPLNTNPVSPLPTGQNNNALPILPPIPTR